jgi:hypothetical protein
MQMVRVEDRAVIAQTVAGDRRNPCLGAFGESTPRRCGSMTETTLSRAFMRTCRIESTGDDFRMPHLLLKHAQKKPHFHQVRSTDIHSS